MNLLIGSSEERLSYNDNLLKMDFMEEYMTLMNCVINLKV